MKEYKKLETFAFNGEIKENDEEIELLEKLLAQKKARKRDKDFEM